MNLLIIDDHALFRQGLSLLLSEIDDSLHSIEAESIDEAISLADGRDVDLVLLDYYLPGESGVEGLEKVRAKIAAPVVTLSSEDDPRLITRVIESGASGFVPKSSTPQVLIAALKLILAGGTYLPPNVLDFSLNLDRESHQGTDLPESANASIKNSFEVNVSQSERVYDEDAGHLAAFNNLSDRQKEVLVAAIKGKPNKVIARELSLSEGTIKAHLSSAFRSLGVKNRTEAVYVAAKLGLRLDDSVG